MKVAGRFWSEIPLNYRVLKPIKTIINYSLETPVTILGYGDHSVILNETEPITPAIKLLFILGYSKFEYKGIEYKI
jgi:hypothetical protein